MERAVKLRYLRVNPADKPDFPRIERKEIKPLDDDEIKKFLQIIKGHKYDYIYLATLLTGLREGEVLGGEWSNPMGLVFTSPTGGHLCAQTVYLHFKSLVTEAGFPAARFHELRHSYTVTALQSGDDIKIVQENLGHFSASFTLDVYGHVTEQMKQASAERMERFIKGVSGA